MKKLINWIARLFNDERGNPSSKRFIGIIAGLSLCITMYVNSYTHGDVKPSDALVNSVAMLAFGCLGLASVDKIWGKRNSDENDNKDQL